MPFPSPVSPSYLLEDGGAAVTTSRAGRVSGAARVFDCGAGALFDGYLIFDVSAITTAGDQVYGLRLQACASSDFSSGVVDIVAPGLAMSAVGDHAVIVTNQVVDTRYRYLRLMIDVAGGAPSITLSAWLIHRDSLDDYSLAQLTGLLAVAVTRFTNASQEFRAWAGGVINGGPNGDGEYPLSDGFGNTHLVPCPARIAASAGISYDAINALTARNTPFSHDHAGPVVPIIADGVIRKFPLDLFAARRTQDLAPWTAAGSGIDLQMQILNNDTGISYRVAVAEILNTARGFIDVTAPPYNVRPDGIFTRGAITEAGSNIVEFIEPVAERAQVGHTLQLSNAFGGFPGRTTITEVIDNYHVRIAINATSNFSGNDCLFGTDNTVGMQAALYDARAFSTYTYGSIVMLPAGIILTGALVYYPRSAIFGRGLRQSMLMRLDDGALAPAWYEYWQEFGTSGIANEAHPSFVPTQPAPLLRASSMYADFIAMGDFSIHGARFCQASASYAGLTMFSHLFGTPGPTLPQIDSYPMFSRMHIVETGWNGFEHVGSHAGTIMDVNIMRAGAAGLFMAGFDANISTMHAIACEGPGLYFQDTGGNNNLINLKLSFNGQGNLSWLWGEQAFTNLALNATGNKFSNSRIQESKGCNIWITGSGNTFGDVELDDTGCIQPVHQNWNTPPTVRAAVMLDGADFNRFSDVGYGGAVHQDTNYATHGIFCMNNPVGNSGRLFTKYIEPYDDSQYYANGVTSGAYAPRAVSTSDGGGIAASNRLSIDDQPLSFYYP